jgi:acetylornithine deacetylase/succinyl-diaminopimelate desuccinylase-like protein
MSEKNIEDIFQYIDKNAKDHIARVQEFLRQPSVARQDLGMRECGELLLSYLENLGFKDLELVETDRHPVACGRYDAGSDTTLIIHGMYDTGPAGNEEDWITPPFEARITKIKNLGNCIIAPGALRKAPNATFINAVEAILEVDGNLPVNLVFNVEGEHGLMSPNYPQFYEKYKHKIKDATAVFWPMSNQELDGSIVVKLGNKGMMGFQLECNGKNWGKGPTERPLHSADSMIVDNTTWRLMNALCTMTADDGNKIMIDGYFDDITPPSKEEIKMVDELLGEFDENALKEEFKVNKFVDDLHGKDLLMRHLFSPVLCIGNIHGGGPRPAPYPVSKTDVHIRLVPNQSVEGILQKVRAHLDQRGYTEIKIKPQYGVPWTRTRYDDPLAKATEGAYEALGYEYQLWPTGTKTPPTGVYELPYMDGGLGYGTRGLNELTVVDDIGKIAGIAKCEKYYVSMLYQYGELTKKK